jgi:hypothetical protein
VSGPWWGVLPGAVSDDLEGLARRVDVVAADIAEDVSLTARSEELVARLEQVVGELAQRALDARRAG